MRAWLHKPLSGWLTFVGLELLGLMILFGVPGWPRVVGLVLLALAVVVETLERRRRSDLGPHEPPASG